MIIPHKFKKPCQYSNCPELTHKRFCKKHNSYNSSDRSKPYSHKWRKERARFLKENTLCVRCFKNGKLVKATVVDHVTPHRGDMELFWDRSNWQVLCKSCHDSKTATEDRYQVYKF